MLHRTGVRFKPTDEDATPPGISVGDSLAAMLNRDYAEGVLRELNTKDGMRRTIGIAKVYDSPTDARDVEQAHMLERNKIEADDGEADEADA